MGSRTQEFLDAEGKRIAAAILAALDGWTLVRDDDVVDGRPLLADFGALDARLETAEAEIARLREALAPFAKAYRDWYEDCRRHGFGYGPNAHNRVTVADFERAAKASEEGEP